MYLAFVLSINFIGLKILQIKEKDQKGIARTGKSNPGEAQPLKLKIMAMKILNFK